MCQRPFVKFAIGIPTGILRWVVFVSLERIIVRCPHRFPYRKLNDGILSTGNNASSQLQYYNEGKKTFRSISHFSNPYGKRR